MSRAMFALLLIAFVLPWSAADRAAAMELGLQDDAVFYDDHAREWGLDHAEELGVRRVRLNVTWGAVYRAGRFDFSRLDRTVDAIRRRGIWVQFTLMGTPRYDETSDQGVAWDDVPLRRWGWFCRSVAKHFRGRVRRFSIWNEPNIALFYTGGPAGYRQIYDVAYRQIKRVSRHNRVLLGELAPTSDAAGWLEAVIGGRRLRTDGLAHHPYQAPGIPAGVPAPDRRRAFSISNTGYLRRWLRVMRKRRLLTTPSGRTVPFYFTEFGYQSDGTDQRTGRYETAQTGDARRAFLLREAIRHARRAKARQLVLYHLRESAPGTEWNSGLVLRDGTPTSAYWAVQATGRG